jgi:hypothetical protein
MPVYDSAKNEMARRMSGMPGATPGGLQPPTGNNPPPPVGGGQYPPGGAPQMGQSQVEPLLQQVLSILVQGNPADLEAFGRFQAQCVELFKSHQEGQGAAQPPMGGMPPGGTPTPTTPMR